MEEPTIGTKKGVRILILGASVLNHSLSGTLCGSEYILPNDIVSLHPDVP
jgi:hypothetical protein